MASEFLAGLGIFKTIYESANALKEINDASVRNTAVIELQKKPSLRARRNRRSWGS
jgi:hypothetical protein